jgi:hypothetical protein
MPVEELLKREIVDKMSKPFEYPLVAGSYHLEETRHLAVVAVHRILSRQILERTTTAVQALRRNEYQYSRCHRTIGG